MYSISETYVILHNIFCLSNLLLRPIDTSFLLYIINFISLKIVDLLYFEMHKIGDINNSWVEWINDHKTN